MLNILVVNPLSAIDLREALRYVVSGGVATLGNLIAVWIARGFFSFSVSLLCGIAVGMTLSFVLSKLYAFRSREWSAASGEVRRFLIVYCCGLGIYYLAAIAARAAVIDMHMSSDLADLLGVVAGAGLMVVSGYLGHRFFTYRKTVL